MSPRAPHFRLIVAHSHPDRWRHNEPQPLPDEGLLGSTPPYQGVSKRLGFDSLIPLGARDKDAPTKYCP